MKKKTGKKDQAHQSLSVRKIYWQDHLAWWSEQRVSEVESIMEICPLLQKWYIHFVIEKWGLTTPWKILLLMAALPLAGSAAIVGVFMALRYL